MRCFTIFGPSQTRKSTLAGKLRRLDGEQVSLFSLRGRTVVLNFWATWCGPCRVEAPSLAAFADNNPDIAVLGIAADPPHLLQSHVGWCFHPLSRVEDVFDSIGHGFRPLPGGGPGA